MRNREIATRYAQALYFITKERGLTDIVYEQLGVLQKALEKDNSLIVFLVAPNVTDEQKQSALKNIFGSRFEKLLVEFFLLVARKRRESYLLEIIQEYHKLVADKKGFLQVTVTTAHTLSADQRQKLIEKLQTKTGKKVELTEKIDRDIIGGLRVQLKDETIDGAVSASLERLKQKLIALEVA